MSRVIPLSEQKVLVTGAGGFIGSHVVRAFVSEVRELVALVGPGDPIQDWSNQVVTATVDIRQADDLRAHCEDVTTVVHLAGPPAVRDSFGDPKLFADVHTGGTANMLQVAHENDVRRFVYISSAEVYGQPTSNPVKETHRLMARSPYAAAKIGAERFIESFTQFAEFDAVILRPFSIFGPGQTMNSLLGTILRQIETEEKIELFDLRPIRDYCYVSDLANAVVRACFAEVDGLKILNIGSGTGTSVEVFAKLVASVSQRNLDVLQAAESDRPNSANILELVASCELAHQVLRWKPQVSLRDGLRETIQFAGVLR